MKTNIKKIFKNKAVILGGFAVVVLAGFFGFWYYRDQIFSKDILKLEILGPEIAKAGEEITYTVTYKNNGNFVLEKPKLIFQVPDNSLIEDTSPRYIKELKDIYPGQQESVEFKTRLLGKEGEVKTARAWFSYTPHNLSARYESDTTLATKIDTVPLTLELDLPSKTEKGKELSYSLNYFSNIDYPLGNLSIKIDPPQGFNFISADPVSLDNVEWKLDILQKGQGGRISVKGLVTAETGSSVNFSARLGIWQDGNFVVIKEASQEVQIISPQLFISEQINGSSNYVASPGEKLYYEIFLRNIGSTSFDDLFVVMHLKGSAFNTLSLMSGEGNTRPSDGSIVWDSKQIPRLARVAPGQEIKVAFNVTLKDNWPVPDSEKNNILIKNNVEVSGISQEFSAKVNARLELSQKAYHLNQEGIENSGPIPPKATEATTYVIVWQVKNYLNDVKNIKVKAVLPQNVSISDYILPESEALNFSFDSASRQIVWSPGDISVSGQRELSFQISLTPSFSQRGTKADLIGPATVYGEDQVTGKATQSSAATVTTALPDDPENSGGGIVQ